MWPEPAARLARPPARYPGGERRSCEPDDLKLLAELAALNSDVVPLAMSIMDGTVTVKEQHIFARRLITMATQLQARATGPWVINGDAITTTDHGENRTTAHQEP